MTPAGSWITVIFKIVLSNHVTLRALLTISKSGVFSPPFSFGPIVAACLIFTVLLQIRDLMA